MLKDENLGKNFQKGMDKFQNMDYNGNESGGQSDAEAWKSENSEALKYAGDEALRSVDKGLSEARDFASEAKKDVNFRDVQDASVKWALAADSNNEELSNSARDELIGILGEGDPEPYMSDVRPLAEFVEAKDNFDYQNGNYTTTENMDKNYDEDVLNMQTSLKENGYTDKFGDPIKLDGYLGGKTMFAIDAYSSDQAVAEPVAMAASSHSRTKATSVNNSPQKILNTPDNVKKLSDIRLQESDKKLNKVKQQMIKCLSYNYIAAKDGSSDVKNLVHEYANRLRSFNDNSFKKIVLLNNSGSAMDQGHNAFMMINKSGEAIVFSFYPQKEGIQTLATTGEMRFAVLKKDQVNTFLNYRDKGSYQFSMVASDNDIQTESYNRYLTFDLPDGSTGYNAYKKAVGLYKNPGVYMLLFRQCDDIAVALLNEVGIDAKSETTPNGTFEILNGSRK